MTSQKGARSKLADVLADIKNSRAEDDAAPVTAKRRGAVNYVALSGHTPRQSRTHSNNLESRTAQATKIPARPRTQTYILKLFDRPVDFAQFSSDGESRNVPLYPICRAWVRGRNSKSSSTAKTAKQSAKVETDVEYSTSPQHEQVTEAVCEVHSLPPPKTKLETIQQFELGTEDDDIDVRIPQSVRKFKPDDGIEKIIDESIGSMNRQECMELNKKRWKKVRGDWSEARRVHESRYVDSFKVLHEMFISAQRGV